MFRLRAPLMVLVWLAVPSVTLAQEATSSAAARPSGGSFSFIQIIAVGLVVLILAAVAYRRARRSGEQHRRKTIARTAVAVFIGVFGALAFAFGHMSGAADPATVELQEKMRLAGVAGIIAAFMIALAPQLLGGVRRLVSRISGGAKTCPECAESVKEAARKCRYCGYRFDDGGGEEVNGL